MNDELIEPGWVINLNKTQMVYLVDLLRQETGYSFIETDTIAYEILCKLIKR